MENKQIIYIFFSLFCIIDRLYEYVMKHQSLLTLAIWVAKSKTLLEYPHSLSYQLTNLWKFLFKPIPALESKIEDLSSWRKSYETTSSSVYPRIPLSSPYYEASLMALQISS